ncbi:MAG: hypothetical protein ACI4MP_00850 [Candidatus Ventricola sp.]
MRDFPILPILLILYVIAVAGGRKKKTNKQSKQRQRNARAASRTQTREERVCTRTEQTAQGFSAAFGRAQSAPVPEGEDACHPAPERERTEADEPECEAIRETEAGALAQDVLRGVIMSEILTRPCERRARNRRGYHG